MLQTVVEFPDVRRFKNGRPTKCPVCGGVLTRWTEVRSIWICEGLAYPTDDRLPLQECPYYYDEQNGKEFSHA